jgi:zinc protease
MIMKSTCVLICAVVAATLASGKDAPPPGGTPKPFLIPKRETFTLKNGMKVSLIPYGSVPVATFSARVAFGNNNEAAGEVWMADLLWSLVKEGAGDRNGIQLAEEAARMGGQLNTGAGPDNSQASIEVLTEFAPDAVRLLADVLQRPTLPASELDRLRADLLRRLTVELSQPQPQTEQAFAKALYGDHPYGRIYPSEAMLKAYTIDRVRSFAHANMGARRTHLYVVGRFPDSLRRTITEAFEGWGAGPEVKRNPPKADAKKQFILIRPPWR